MGLSVFVFEDCMRVRLSVLGFGSIGVEKVWIDGSLLGVLCCVGSG